MALITCPSCGNKVQDGYIRERSMCPYCGISANEVFRTIEHGAEQVPAQELTSQAKATPNQKAVCGKNYTCPECGAELTQEQLNDNMCPECGCPAINIRAATEAKQKAKEREERTTQKASVVKSQLPRSPDDRYKTTASKMMSVFAWIVWICGAICAFALSFQERTVGYYYTYTESYFNFVTFAIVAASCFVSGAMFYAASKMLLDLHAVRVNLELLNENKEG